MKKLLVRSIVIGLLITGGGSWCSGMLARLAHGACAVTCGDVGKLAKSFAHWSFSQRGVGSTLVVRSGATIPSAKAGSFEEMVQEWEKRFPSSTYENHARVALNAILKRFGTDLEAVKYLRVVNTDQVVKLISNEKRALWAVQQAVGVHVEARDISMLTQIRTGAEVLVSKTNSEDATQFVRAHLLWNFYEGYHTALREVFDVVVGRTIGEVIVSERDNKKAVRMMLHSPQDLQMVLAGKPLVDEISFWGLVTEHFGTDNETLLWAHNLMQFYHATLRILASAGI